MTENNKVFGWFWGIFDKISGKIWKKASLKKRREIFLYLFFGALTTLVNLVVYFGLAKLLHVNEVLSNVIAWVVSVAFAYATNKVYVFESPARTRREVMREMTKFVQFRLLSGALDTGLFAICVTVLGWNDTAVKLVLQVVVIVLNYIFSKLWVFKRRP